MSADADHYYNGKHSGVARKGLVRKARAIGYTREVMNLEIGRSRARCERRGFRGPGPSSDSAESGRTSLGRLK